MACWKPINGYEERYAVSDEGQILSLPKVVNNGKVKAHRKAKLLKPGTRGRGNALYAFVILSDGHGKTEHKAVHRIVAEAFLDNPLDLPEVNHKDENSLNNHVDNLEWCTRRYNIEYSKNKHVEQYLDGVKIAEYKSITYASNLTGISRTAINNVLTGWSKTAGGYEWAYTEKEG